MNELAMAEALEAFLRQLVGADEFSGAVLVARDNTPFFRKAYGLASKSFDVPNQPDTKFNLASMNKMFTGVAITQLAERGKLSFQDSIATYLPSDLQYPKEIAERATIHHLLTHTSGMGSYWNEQFEATKVSLRKVRDFLPLFMNDPLLFQPGERWHYSNAGFMMLGAVVEQASGQDYFDYVREHIYRPAGMYNTDTYELDQPVPNMAVGYTHMNFAGKPESEVWHNNLFLHVVKGGPAGGGFSTVDDLLQFSTALRRHVLLNPEYTDIMLTGKVDRNTPGMKYGYGFGVEDFNGGRIVGHSGGFAGISTRLDMYLEAGYTVVVLSNYDPPIADHVTREIRGLLGNL